MMLVISPFDTEDNEIWFNLYVNLLSWLYKVFHECYWWIISNEKFCGDLKPPLFRRISGRYITDFRCLSKKDQNMISYDIADDIPISQDNKCKYKGINLFDVSKKEVSSASVVKKDFVILSQKPYEISQGIYQQV